MLASVTSHGLMGIGGFCVRVETDISNGLPSYETVGLPDAAVKESKERVRAAIKNSGFAFPTARVTVNLAPADMRKEGALYDLPIALSILAASGQLGSEPALAGVFLGELALDGSVRAVSGVLPMIIDAQAHGETRFFVPPENGAEASYLPNATVYAAPSLRALAAHIRGEEALAPVPPSAWDSEAPAFEADFSQIKGQQGAKRAAEIAVAGGHNLLLIGTPGSGKTMLARSLPSIMPDLTFGESLEITKIHSIVGATKGRSIVRTRPFRAPHHGASSAALVGGGTKAQPGEISLAHYGVLFLDELPEFGRDVLEALRQPLEDGFITISRAAYTASYPAEFILVAAMNPCPCGNYGSRINPCRCSSAQVNRYRARISGPLLDRIDMQVEMPEVGYTELSDNSAVESSATVRLRVNAARERQRARFSGSGIVMNAQMNTQLIKQYCAPDAASEKLLRQAFAQWKLSARAYQRILKVARTIADVEKSDAVLPQHYAEAIQYRSLDFSDRGF